MRFKVHSENRCPHCGWLEVAERVHRGWLIRWFRPGAVQMKCRMCLTRFLVRKNDRQ